MNSTESINMRPQLAPRFARGVFWTGGSSVITSLVRFLIIAVLARLLAPQDFGLFSLSLLVVDFGNDVGDFGTGSAIIQHHQVTRPMLNTVFWISLLGNIGLFFGAVIVAPLAAWFFHEKMLFGLIVVSSISFPIRSAGFVQRAIMQKKLLFNKIAAIDVCSTLVFGTVAIVLAYRGLGVWSLIYGMLAHRLADVILLWCLSDFRPALEFRREECGFIYRFAKNVTGERIAYFFSSRMDYIIVGRLLGAAVLGYYTLASEITSTPQKRISTIVSSVAVPTFSLLQGQVAALRNAYVKVSKTLAMVTFPLLAGLAALAPEFVYTFYGQRWAPVIVPMQILCAAGAIRSIMHIDGAILYARLRPDIGFRWALIQLVTIPVPLIVGASYGIVGVAIALSVTFVLYFVYMQNVTNAQISLRFADYLRGFLPIVVGSITLGCASIFAKAILASTIKPGNGITLITAALVGGVLYVGLIRLIDRSSLNEIATLAREVLLGKLQLYLLFKQLLTPTDKTADVFTVSRKFRDDLKNFFAPKKYYFLEVGCYRGLTAKALAHHFIEYLGLDISRKSLLIARIANVFSRNARFQRFDIYNTDWSTLDFPASVVSLTLLCIWRSSS